MDRTESNFIADKQKEYRLYLIWQSLDKTLTPETLESWGITDETLLELSQYKTQNTIQNNRRKRLILSFFNQKVKTSDF